MTTEEIAVKLAVASNRHGMWVHDVVRFPDILQEIGVEQADLTMPIIERAHEVTREQMARMQRKLAAINARSLESPVAATPDAFTAPARSPKREASGKQVKLFDQSVTAVLRAMGKQGGWKAEDALLAIETLCEKKFSITTVRLQLKAGSKGERGEPATLTSAQFKKLVQASK